MSATKSAPRGRKPRPVQPARPLLIVDGDSFAHRAYHALPKTIRRGGDKGGGAIVGFANSLLRLYEAEQPRAVLVGWDTLEAPTFRHQAFEAYQSGREFDDELVEQLGVLPQLVAACGFANAKAAGFEADDFLAAAVAREARRGGTAVVATGDRDAFQLASPSTTIVHPVRGGGLARIGPDEVRARYGVEPHQVPDFIALRGDPSDRLPGARGVGAVGRRRCAAPLRDARERAGGRAVRRAGGGVAALPPHRHHGRGRAASQPCATRPRPGTRPRRSRAPGSSTRSPTASPRSPPRGRDAAAGD